MRNWSLRRAPTAVKLFLTCWIVYGLHFATDIVREHYPAFSLAERGTLRVDPYLGLHPDLFALEGRGAYINNNPGASLLGAIPYALARPLVDRVVESVQARRARGAPLGTEFEDDRPNRVQFFREVRERGLDIRFGLAAFVTHAFCMALLSALSAVVMRAVLLRAGFSSSRALWLALLYALGTPIFFRTGHLNHNLIVAHFTFFAFALLFRPDEVERRASKLVLAGAVVGYGLLCDYSAAVAVLALGSYQLAKLWTRDGLRRAVAPMTAMVVGALLPIAALLAYQAWAFGHPFLPAQHYMPATEFSGYGWNGFDWPSPDMLWRNLFDPAYGIFSFGPLLALALAAPFVPRRDQRRVPTAEIAYALGLFAAMLIFTSANQYARLQWNTGFRMLAPAVAPLFLCAAPVLLGLPRRVAVALGVAAVLHSWCIAMVRAGAFDSVVAIWEHGFTFPWLTSIWRAGDQYLPFLAESGAQGLPGVLFAAVLVLFVWGPPRRSSPPA